MWVTKFSKILDFSQKLGSPSTKKHPFLKNQVQISKTGQNFMKIRGLVKIGARRRKNLSRRRKIFVKNIFYFRQKNVVKISKNWGRENVEFRTSHTAGNPYILQYFHENSGRKTSKKAPKFPGNPYILANLGPKFSPKLSKISRWPRNFVENCQKWSKMTKNGQKWPRETGLNARAAPGKGFKRRG